jgi:hypothetical protein
LNWIIEVIDMKYIFLFILLISISNTVIGHRLSVIDRHPVNRQSRICGINRQPTANDTSSLNRPSFYKAMQGENKDLVNSQLTELKAVEPKNLQNAFMGAMIMKKAGIGGSPTTKLHLFKEGHKLLEAAILQDPKNAEYRFLRLMIQENAPGILGYKSDEEKDSEFIRKSYKSLPPDLQHVIADYNKKSKVLKLEVS